MQEQNKTAQKKLIGVYQLGFRDKTSTLNRLLGFGGIPVSKFAVTQDAAMPFLDEEFDLQGEYEVKFITNDIDSLGGQPRKNEVQIAVAKVSGDTLVYQECSYVFRRPEKDQLILTLMIYDNQNVRSEMLDFLDDVKDKVNKYSEKGD